MTPDRLPFRELDNSSTTRMGYNLEVQHWLTSAKSAQASSTSGLSALGIVGFFISIAVHIIMILIVLFLMLLEWVVRPNEPKVKPEDVHKPKYFGEPDKALKEPW